MRGIETHAALGMGMVTIAIDLLPSEEVVLRPIAGFDPLGQLHLAGIETAMARSAFVVVATARTPPDGSNLT